MKIGSLVTMKDDDRIGRVVSINGNLIVVRYSTGSKIIAHYSFFNVINSTGGVYVIENFKIN